MSDRVNISGRRTAAFRLAASRQWDRLLEAAKAWLSEDPQSADAHRYAAQSLVNLRRHRDAEKHLQSLLASRPSDVLGHRMMSMVHFELRQFRKADESIQRAISISPNDALNWYHLARMAYLQQDKESGFRWISKARELAPDNSEIVNLYALCSGNIEARLQSLKEALALNPGNANAHNNLGLYYLNIPKDYKQAEACFRSALALSPSLKTARSNLFKTIQHRDRIYRLLCAPRDFTYSLFKEFANRRGRSTVIGMLGVLLWIIFLRFVLGVLIFWFALVWPMVKVYEYLVVGDIRAKAGEAAARRGGIWGYRNWSLKLRMVLFGMLLSGFWCAMYFLLFRKSGASDVARSERVAVVSIVAIIGLMIFVLTKILKRLFYRLQSWRRNRRLNQLEAS